MPQYHDIPYDLGNGFRFIVTPLPLWRRVFKSFPYFVGDRVRFRVKAIEVKNDKGHVPRPTHYLHEFFRDKEKQYSIIEGLKDFEGNIIDGEGDIKYSISALPSHEGVVIMTGRVINKDSFFIQAIFFIAGSFVTIIGIVLAWILGYIKIIW